MTFVTAGVGNPSRAVDASQRACSQVYALSYPLQNSIGVLQHFELPIYYSIEPFALLSPLPLAGRSAASSSTRHDHPSRSTNNSSMSLQRNIDGLYSPHTTDWVEGLPM